MDDLTRQEIRALADRVNDRLDRDDYLIDSIIDEVEKYLEDYLRRHFGVNGPIRGVKLHENN